jgi:hypothetical protein
MHHVQVHVDAKYIEDFLVFAFHLAATESVEARGVVDRPDGTGSFEVRLILDRISNDLGEGLYR